MRTNQTIKRQTSNPAAAAAVTFPPFADRRWRLVKVLASYSDPTFHGMLTVVSDQQPLPDGSDPAAVTVIDVDLDSADIDEADGIQMPNANAAMTVTLSAGSGVIVAKLNVIAIAE